jgi:predicted nucleic acid-binding protein
MTEAGVNLVDSCGWLEYFANGPNADFFAPAVEAGERLVVPTLCLYEVFKRVLQQRGEGEALRCMGLMRQARCAELSEHLALNAARLSVDHRLSLADSVILATARHHQASLWTQDAHFEGLAGVKYIRKTV